MKTPEYVPKYSLDCALEAYEKCLNELIACREASAIIEAQAIKFKTERDDAFCSLQKIKAAYETLGMLLRDL